MAVPDVSGSSLPPLYERWVEELLQASPPVETRSTCHDCPMISDDPARNASEHRFHSQTKCCTYWPEIPNFLAGFILQDKHPELEKARAQMEFFLTSEMTISPLGASPPAAFVARYNKLKPFGTESDLRCPFYQEDRNGNCGIWKYRNSRCATWFCRFSRGSVSVIFWKYMDQLLTAIERNVARWCILQIGFVGEALHQLFPPPGSQTRASKKIWGDWIGKERELFVECAHLASTLSWMEISKIGGVEIEISARLLREAQAALLSKELPARLRINRWKQCQAADPHTLRIWTYSRYDPVEVPRRVIDVLPYFQNNPSEQALEQIEREKGIRLERSYVRFLTDFGVLIEGE